MSLLMTAQSKSAGTDKRGPLGRAKGTSSWVHEHFQVYANCKTTANCNLCFKDLQWNSSTSTLTDHLKKVHLPTYQAALTKKAEDTEAAEREAAQLKANTQPIADMKGSYQREGVLERLTITVP